MPADTSRTVVIRVDADVARSLKKLPPRGVSRPAFLKELSDRFAESVAAELLARTNGSGERTRRAESIIRVNREMADRLGDLSPPPLSRPGLIRELVERHGKDVADEMRKARRRRKTKQA